ncbi:hypothetical protein Tco_1210075 [Tanacetum coccineum]
MLPGFLIHVCEKQAGVKRFDLIQTFHVCKLEDGKSVGAYVLKMKDYMEQLERLGYMLLQDLSVGLILNGLTIIVVYREHYCSRRLNDGIIMLELVACCIPSWFSEVQLCLLAFNAELKEDDRDDLVEEADSGLQSYWDTGS